MPKGLSSALATAPAATRAAVSRALARSSTLRTSSKPYFSAPARSACPGRTRVTFFWMKSPPASTCIGLRQFSQSLLGITMVSGDPSVRPPRTPLTTWAASCSMSCRPPRP